MLTIATSPFKGIKPSRCMKHWDGSKRTHTDIMQTPTKSLPALTPRQQANFWKKINRDGPTMPNMDTPCWVWTACKGTGGYGQFGIGHGNAFGAHRIAFVLDGGVFPEGKNRVCHHCDNPICCRASHLYAGDDQDNARDREARGRRDPARGESHGSQTKPERLRRGQAHGMSKLTDDQVSYIRSSALSGAALGLELGVSRANISCIRRGKSRIPYPPINPQNK
jgi:hypothetical protein